MIIISLLASLVAPKLFKQLGKSQTRTAEAQIEMISTALDAFRLDVGRYPTTEEGLEILWTKPGDLEKYDGPYLPKPVNGDPWGGEYHYEAPGENDRPFELYTLGADGKEGGERENQDVSYWE